MSSPTPQLSLCIPTHRRPSELAEAVASALELQVRPLEILIGDDSPAGDERTATWVEQLRCRLPEGVTLHIRRHCPSLGQVRNVDALLRASRGRWVSLLHDDDRLVPAGMDQLLAELEAQPEAQAGFGLQRLLRADGQLDPEGAERLNTAYGRVAGAAGLISDPLVAAIGQQFPNDGWIARGELVRQLGYRQAAADAGDFDFGLRLAQASQAFWYLHAPCCDYRLSPQAVSTARGAQFPLQAYRILEQLPCRGAAASARHRQLARMLQPAAAAAVHSGQRRTALRLLLSLPWWRNLRRWPRGLAYLLLLAWPGKPGQTSCSEPTAH
jgi:GT2 family glycosyltransferase